MNMSSGYRATYKYAVARAVFYRENGPTSHVPALSTPGLNMDMKLNVCLDHFWFTGSPRPSWQEMLKFQPGVSQG